MTGAAGATARVPAVRVSGPGWRARLGEHPQAADALVWAALVTAGLALTAVAVRAGWRVGTDAAPFAGRWRSPRVVPASLLGPAVAALVLAGVRAGLVERLPWRVLLLASWVAASAWAVGLALVDGSAGLAGPVRSPDEYLADAGYVGGHPAAFLRDFVGLTPHLSLATRTHPPGAALLVALVSRGLGIHGPLVVGTGVALVGALVVPLVGVATRELCHEAAGRRVLPLLALSPAALWVAVSLDAVTAAVAAGAVTAGVLATARGRSSAGAGALALLAGALLGCAALLSYAVVWLGASVLAVFFARRRPVLNLLAGAGALLPLALTSAAGFAWTTGLATARHETAVRLGATRSWPLWVALDAVLLVVVAGPALVAAVRGLRRTPGWPFVVGGAAAVVFSVASGLVRGEVERSWLPFLPWLLVPAVAPLVRPAEAGRPDAPSATPVPLGLVALGAATAVVLQAVLVSPW